MFNFELNCSVFDNTYIKLIKGFVICASPNIKLIKGYVICVSPKFAKLRVNIIFYR